MEPTSSKTQKFFELSIKKDSFYSKKLSIHLDDLDGEFERSEAKSSSWYTSWYKESDYLIKPKLRKRTSEK